MPKKKTAPKKVTRQVTRKVTPKAVKKSWWQEYCEQREHFFTTHPQARWLLALFVIGVAIYIAILVRVNYVLQVSDMMAAEGLEYEIKIIPWLGW